MAKPESVNKGFWKNPWTISLGSVLFTFIIPTILDIIKSRPFLSTISKIATTCYQYIIAFFIYKIPVYALLILILLVIMGIISLFRYQERKLLPEQSTPDYLNWTRGRFKKWTWNWNWFFDEKSQSYKLVNFQPVCDRCSFLMYNDPGYAIYKCPNCDKIYGSDGFENWFEISLIIQQKIQRGDYPKNTQENNV